MKDLPELYNHVTAKRPELCVPAWRRQGEWKTDEETAAALILARWVDQIPAGCALTRLVPDKWAVWNITNPPGNEGIKPTPIEALAAFYLS